MKYCQKCGAEINENAVVCVKCGCSTNPSNQLAEVDDTISIGLVILSLIIPLFGIIYWPVKAKSRPKCAMTCGITGIASWIVGFLFTMIVGSF